MAGDSKSHQSHTHSNNHNHNDNHSSSHNNIGNTTKSIKVDLKKMDGLVEKILVADRARKKLFIQNQKSSFFFASSISVSIFFFLMYNYFDINAKTNYMSFYRNRGLTNLEFIIFRNSISMRELVNPEIYYLEKKVNDKKFNEYLKKNYDSDKLESFVWA